MKRPVRSVLGVLLFVGIVPSASLARPSSRDPARAPLLPTTPGTCPVQGLIAVSGNNSVSLSWRPEGAPGFDHYAVYRSTTPFSTVVGLTPVSTFPSPTDTTWVDTGPTNGTTYYYAVTSIVSGGPDCGNISSIGPRRPRSETDLQVVTISRQPRFPRFDPIYSTVAMTEPSGFGPYNVVRATGLGGGQTPSTQRWPNLGDPVTYLASVRNRGTNTWAGTIHGEWLVDGAGMAFPNLAGPLAAGDRRTASFVTSWDGLSHAIEFRVLDTDARSTNNSLSIDTKSVAFLAYVDRSHIEDFRDAWTPLYPLAATDDFFDWINRSTARLNQLFANGGTAKRIHYDVLEEVRDGDPDPNVARINFASFPFRFHVGQDNFRATSAYYNAADDVDYGYLHEMGHQLGLIDIYQMSVAPSGNQVSGLEYSPANDLMFNVSPLIGPSSATAMTHWLDVAHGYYGQYLYQIPRRVIVMFRKCDGSPLVNASVKLYQYCDRPGLGQVLTAQVKASGLTNARGYWEIPNVQIDTTVVPPTYAGDTLRANPWGYVNMLGNNGALHFEVQANGRTDYAWLDITEANVAFYTGQRDSAFFQRTLNIGPADLRLRFEGNPTAEGGEAPTTATNIAYETGALGSGVFLGPGNQLQYAAACNIRGAQGTVRFWIKPRWNGNDGQGHFALRFGTAGGILIGKDGGNFWRIILNRYGGAGGPELGAGLFVNDWVANQWHHVAFTWGPDTIKVYVDGSLRTAVSAPVPPPSVNATDLQLGADGGSSYLDAVIDEVAISDTVSTAEEIRTGVEESPADFPGFGIRLGPVIPNPAWSRVNVTFELARPGPVRLDIVDVQGRRVCTLVNAIQGAGPHSVTWDGLSGGVQVSSGLYWLVGNHDGKKVSRKLVLIR